MNKRKLIKIIRESIKAIENKQLLNEQCAACAKPQPNWNGQYQYHFCAAGNPSTTNNQAQGWTCPNARLVRARNCNPTDTQNYYLVTEIGGNVPQVGNTYCSDPNSNLSDVTGPCNQETLEIKEVFTSGVNTDDIVYPKMDIGGCPGGTSTGGKFACSNLAQPLGSNWTANINTAKAHFGDSSPSGLGWQFVFECLIKQSNNPCSLLDEKYRRWQAKINQPGANPTWTTHLAPRMSFAATLSQSEGCGSTIMGAPGEAPQVTNLSPGSQNTITFQGGTWNQTNWENDFSQQVSNAGNPCNLLTNKINAWNTKLATLSTQVGPQGGVGWNTQQESMLRKKIEYAESLQAQNNC